MSDELSAKKCLPCEGGMPAMSPAETNQYMSKVLGWELLDNIKIKKEFKFKDFKQALDFVNKVAVIAEQEQHHPTITIIYNKVRIVLSTHAIGGLSQNDFIMAAKIDRIYKVN